MTLDRPTPSELLQAAEAFDSALARHEKLVDEFRSVALDSQQRLQDAARALEGLGASEANLGQTAQTLVAALVAARQRQEAKTRAVQERAEEIQARAAVAASLLERYEAVGRRAGELNTLVLKAAAGEPEASTMSDLAVVKVLREVRARMTELVESAKAVADAARASSFEDIAAAADSMTEQITSVGEKVGAMERTLAARSAPG